LGAVPIIMDFIVDVMLSINLNDTYEGKFSSASVFSTTIRYR